MAGNDSVLKTITSFITSLIKGCFFLLIAFVDIILKVVLLVGALTSMVLLYKLFPDIATPIYTSLFVVFNILLDILKILVIFLIAFLIAFIFSSFEKMRKDIKNKREKEKKEFFAELIARLKKEKLK